MKYISTRGGDERITSAEAIKRGIARNGGLYVPESIPRLEKSDFDKLAEMDYVHRAAYILSVFLDDYDADGLLTDCREAYNEVSFPGGAAPVSKLEDGMYVLELYHGPTCAFKDMALQLMPRLLTRALRMTGEEKTAYILVATSGDTGKAALEGYRDVDGVCIKVFYPVDGVSDIQKLQMATQAGKNVSVQAIDGNFDDAQNGVKKIFADKELNAALNNAGYILTSANSINWGRLAPQIVYYISAYLDLVNSGDIAMGEEIAVTVPTGNFGNIFAGYIAKHMGLPVKKLVCASNKNNILTDFLETGVYDRNRRFYQTASPSMDILISSNLERLLFEACGAEATSGYMSQLANEGKYRITAEELAAIRSDFYGDFTDEGGTLDRIKETWDKYGYLADTHTAVALSCAGRYRAATGDKTLVVSTASPYKFAADVLKALGETADEKDGAFAPLYALKELTKAEIPSPLSSLAGRDVRFKGSVPKEIMAETLLHKE